MECVSECFLDLIKYDTQADGCSDTYPSTKSQLDFAEVLVEKCKSIGLHRVELDRHGYVTATLPSNLSSGADAADNNKDVPVIGLLAHMDTSPDALGEAVNARVVKNYDGKDIKLNDNMVLSPKEFTHLSNYIGQDLIVTDGNTLLGADDKAGIAEILTAMKYLIDNNDTIPHGDIRIAFTPDEEIGRGVDYFDVAGFGADFAYTIDGGEIGELECENFNGAQATFTITGKSVHPGTAKGTMINASQVAGEIIAAFPPNETPVHTEGYEGFYHLTAIVGEVGSGKLAYILRDHDANKFEERKKFALSVAQSINYKYGQGTVEIEIQDQYRNMHEILKDHMYIMERAKKAMSAAGVTHLVKPIRGGTDGARLSFMGLPCPNIFAGGHNSHGPYEYIPIQSMEAAVKVIVNICRNDL